MTKRDEKWLECYALNAEGHRIGVMTCRRCGAAVLVDDDKAAVIHDEWHTKLEVRFLDLELGRKTTF